MAAVPAGMESSSDSDEADMVHFHEISDNLALNTDDPKVNSTANFEERNPNIISYSNGNANTTFSTSVAKRNLMNSQKSNLHKRRRCVDFKTKELLDDFRFAVMQGNFEIVSSVINNGMFVDTVLNADWTALMYASSCGHHEIVKFLLDKNADPNFQKDLFTPLMAACASSNDEQNLLKCCQYLLEYGANINVQERHHTSPLMFAAREGHTEIVKELLKHGIHLNSKDNKGRTALAWAASKGFGQIVRLLLLSGADPNIVTFGGLTPAELAYDEGYKEIASLLQKGSELRGEDESSKDLKLVDNVPNLSAKGYSRIPTRSLQDNQKPLDEAKCYVKQGDLELLLTGIGLPELIHTFKENHLTFQDVLILTDSDLEKVGVTSYGARKKILDAAKISHRKEWQTSSLPDLSSYISCPDAVAMTANISKHLQYITSSVVYIRQQIQAQPRILELGQDSSNIYDLIDETKDSLKHALLLSEELRFLKLHLDKVQDNVEYIPADLIVETVPQSKTTNKKIVYGAVLTVMTITIAGVLLKKSKSLIDLITSIPLLDNFFPS